MITSRPRPDAFCETDLFWRWGEEDDSAQETWITTVYHGPEEYSSAGPFFEHRSSWELCQDGSRLTLLVRRWKIRQGYPDEESRREGSSLSIYQSEDQGRSWEGIFETRLGHFTARST